MTIVVIKIAEGSEETKNIWTGDTVFVYFTVKKSGRAYRFVSPFQGPSLVEEVFDNGV